MTVTIWHNPRCSKSRETLALIRAQGIEPQIRLYLENPPSVEELRAALALLGQPALALARTKDAAFREAGLTPSTPDEAVLVALTRTPALIERPLVMTGTKAAIGRPPEAVLAIL